MNYKIRLKDRFENTTKKRIRKVCNNMKSKKNRDKAKNNYKFIAFLVIAMTIAIIIFRGHKLFSGSAANKIEDKLMSIGMGGGFPYKIDDENIVLNNFSLMNGNIVLLTSSTLESINTSGKKISSRKHNMNKPIMKSAGNISMLYDSGSHNYKIEICSRTIMEGSSENNIINCAISEEGTYGMVTESDNYVSQIAVFNRDGKEKYKYYFAENYISDMDIRSDGQSAVVSGISTVDGELKSIIYVFRFDSEKPEYTYEYCDNMIVSVRYLSRRKVAAIGDKGISIIDTWDNASNELSYNGRVLKCVDINRKFGLSYCLSNSKYSRSCEVVGIDKEGKTKFNMKIDHCFDSIVYAFNSIFGVENGTVYVYDTNSDIKYQKNTGILFKKIIPISSSCIYALDHNCIKQIYLK